MVKMRLHGRLLLHMSGTDPNPVNIDGMEYIEWDGSDPLRSYPVYLNFKTSERIGYAHIQRDPSGLVATVYVYDDAVEAVRSSGCDCFAAGLMSALLTSTDNVIAKSRLDSVALTSNNVDPSIQPFDIIEP